MSGNLDFLLSAEEKSFLKAVDRQLNPPALTEDGLFNNVLEDQFNTFPTIDYSYKSSPSVLHDIVSLVSCHLRQLAG